MPEIEFLAAELDGAGFAVAELAVVKSGSFSVAAVVALRGGGRVFAKAGADADMSDVEAAGLMALRELSDAFASRAGASHPPSPRTRRASR